MANEKLFKGILQYKSTDTFTKQAGYIYFVREMSGDTPTGNAEIYFGTRKYGDIQATQLKALEDAISANSKDIDAIEAKLGQWTENLGTVASAVVAVSGATQTNATDIKKLQDSLAEGGATAAAIAAAQAAADAAQDAADAAQADVDAIEKDYLKAADKTELQGNIDKKLAISAFEAYSAATKTAYEKVASDEADAAEAAAKAYVDAISADTRLEALEAISADTRLDALEAISGQSHTHSNKALLDTYTQTEANLADAVAKKHEHSNKAELDKIEDGDKALWDAAAEAIDAFLKGEAISGSTVDTLKEIQNYITSDGQAAADMLSAIASAQTAADNAQKDVDAIEKDYLKASDKTELQGNIDKKLAISAFEAYSAATETAYETAASDAEKAAKEYASAYTESAITKLDLANTYDEKGAAASALTEAKAYVDAISASTRLEALEDDTHTHSNKTVLDGISAEKVTAWDGAEQKAKDYADEKVNALATGAVATNTAAIATLTGTGEGSVSKAVADAKSELQGNIDKKLNTSDFNTYSGNTANTLAQIQSALTQANESAVKNVTAADASVVVTGDNADKKVAVKLSSIEGNMIALKEDGLYAAMYYGGDDVE